MRERIKSLKPYTVLSRDGYICLDSNESCVSWRDLVPESVLHPLVDFNRYPNRTEELEKAYASYSGIPASRLTAGNGSDEWISLICQFALDPGDRVAILEPDFSMYEKGAAIMGADIIKVELNKDFTLPAEELKAVILERKTRIVFLSNPNNPSGKSYPNKVIEEIAKVLKTVGGYLVLDEAYIEFSSKPSFADLLPQHSNVIILRTASKALGLAALRLGFLAANEELVAQINKVKPPYNVNSFSAAAGACLLKEEQAIKRLIGIQKRQKKELEVILKDFSGETGAVLHPSDANFFLLESEHACELYEHLLGQKIKVRYFGTGRLSNGIRISPGTAEEHHLLQASLKKWRSECHA